ncbi:MAG: hypothetical protein IJX89_05250 [Alphaproteobacteria bacterium]|nr:hypothetical protein [Alphaproteobacteria bacterium]
MKNRTLIFASLLCLCGALPAQSSECTGAGCDVAPLMFEEFEWVKTDDAPTAIVVAKPTQPVQIPTWMEADTMVAQMPVAQNLPMPVRNIDVKMLSIKPVPEDSRPALWDGVHGKYTGPDADKTVDWRDGVPIWDDSVNSYRYKDYSDWYLTPSPEIYVREISTDEVSATDPIALYQQNMEDAAATRARVEELLAPKKPSDNLWFESAPRAEYVAQDMTEIVTETFGADCVIDDGCPFETETECEIWRRKPIVRETVSPRSPKLRQSNIAAFIHAADCNKHIEATAPEAAPLLDRYKMLMRSAQACCTDGMAYALKQAGASEGLIYKFLSDDANFYGFGSRCLMMTDYDLDSQYPNTATSVVAADVRNGCLCRGRQWFKAMLAPFEQAYSALPEFKDAQFNYTYKDGLQREITVSINNDVQNVLKQLEQCP